MTGGIAVLDYDGDGRQDVYFVNGAPQPSLEKSDPAWHNRLYRNLGGMRFEDVTLAAGVQGSGFMMGAAAADYDNDGDTDLYVTGVRRNVLYRNKGDGTFEDVTAKAKAGGGLWSVAAGWFDYDSDGDLDLFVVNYVTWDPAREPFCGDSKKTYRTYCHPKFYDPLPNTLYRNDGDGTFTDVSVESGIAAHRGKGMGLAFADYDLDGRMDAMVANDTVPNFLFHNEGGGKFREVGVTAGIAFNEDGLALSSMGVDFRDVDNDGAPDVFVTALANETFPLYRNAGKGQFVERTQIARIAAATLPLSGWGTGIYDFDNDGRKDLFAANGDVNDNTEVFSSRRSRQRNLLLLQTANGTFAAQPIGSPAMHRGAAFADFDGDGRVDVVVSRLGERPVFYRNTLGAGNHWLGVRLVGTRGNRDGIGARVRVGRQWNHVSTSVGYASSSERVVRFGLGKETAAEVEVWWPAGGRQIVRVDEVDRVVEVRER